MTHPITIGNVKIGNNLPLVLIAGPCQIENQDMVIETALFLDHLTKSLGIPFIFKTSFDKANRTSISGKRGVGIKAAIEIFTQIKNTIGCPTLTDVHTAEQCAEIAPYVDVLQIPALLCRQTDLLLAAGRTGKAINIKKGQFMAPWNMQGAVDKVLSTGNEQIMLTERGTSFGYNTLISDMRSLPIMQQTGFPVIFDATHSVQQPSSQGDSSGGERQHVRILSRAAVAVGVAGLFIETHPEPDLAYSDGPCMLPLHSMSEFLKEIMSIDNLIKSYI